MKTMRKSGWREEGPKKRCHHNQRFLRHLRHRWKGRRRKEREPSEQQSGGDGEGAEHCCDWH